MDAAARKKELEANIAAANVELEALTKSQKTGGGSSAEEELEAMLKSLETGLGGDPLQKSGDGDTDDKDGKADDDKGDKDKGDKDKKGDKGGEPDETEMEKSLRLAAEAEVAAETLCKSGEGLDREALIEASEAFGALEGSIQKSHGHIAEQLETMAKSMASSMNLLVKMAGVISVQSQEIAAMKKSREEDMDTLKKSMETLGAKPVIPNKAVLGVGRREIEETLAKSVSEVNELLIKSSQEGKIDVRYIGIHDTYKTLDCLPEEVRKIIDV